MCKFYSYCRKLRVLLLMFLLFTTLYGSENTFRIGSSNNKCFLSVETLITTAFKAHPSLQMSRQMIKSANAQVDGAKWGYFPTPSLELSQSSGKRGTIARLDQPIWTGGKLDASVDIATSKREETEFILQESGYILIENIIAILQRLIQVEGYIFAYEDGKNQLELFRSMLDRRIETGVSSLSDSELIKARLTQIDADLTVSYLKRKTLQSQLELLIGTPLSCGIEFNNTDSLNQNISIDQLMERMIDTHPTLKKLSAQIKTAHAEVEKAKAAVWPNVSLRAEHQSGSVYYDQASTNNMVYIAVQASPGAGLIALSNIQSFESKVLEVQYEKLSKERDLTDSLLQDYESYYGVMDRIEGINKTLIASQNVLESYTRLFIAGKRQWLDLVNASRELTQYKVALADLRASKVASAYRLALKSGAINIESGEMK